MGIDTFKRIKHKVVHRLCANSQGYNFTPRELYESALLGELDDVLCEEDVDILIDSYEDVRRSCLYPDDFF